MDVQEPGLQESKQRWRSAVAGVLAKSTRRDPADLPPEPERLLDSPTYEGFPIRALYTSLDALPEPPLPGDWPFVRGGDALRDVKSGWKVAEAFPVAGQKAVTDGNGAVLVALTEGVSALVLRVGAPDGVVAAELDRLLEGVFLDLVPVVLDAGADFVAAAEAVLPLLADMDDDQRARLSIDLGADPLTAPLSGQPVRRHRRRRRDRGQGHELRGRRTSHHRRRARIAQPRRQRVLGAGRSRGRGGRLPAAAGRGRAERGGLVTADQLPVGR